MTKKEFDRHAQVTVKKSAAGKAVRSLSLDRCSTQNILAAAVRQTRKEGERGPATPLTVGQPQPGQRRD